MNESLKISEITYIDREDFEKEYTLSDLNRLYREGFTVDIGDRIVMIYG